MRQHTNYTPAAYQSAAADEARLGPAMKALNPRRRAVIYWLLDNGRGSNRGDWLDACRAAGYSVPDEGDQMSETAIRVTSHRLRHDPRMSEALIEEGKRRVANDLPTFLATIRTIGANTAHKDALKAALAGAAMVGVSPLTISKTEHTHVHTSTLMDDVRAAAAVLGIDPDEMLRGRMKDVTPAPPQIENNPDLDISDLY